MGEQAAIGTDAGGPNVVGSVMEFVNKLRPWTLVNCWHKNEHESAAMWNLYCSTSEGVAIRSTFEQLDELLPNHAFIGEVTYIAYDTDSIPVGNLFFPFTHKRMSFEHERELRAVIQNTQLATSGIGEPPEDGEWCKVDLNRLINRIYVAPTAKKWMVDLVTSVANKYELRKDVQHSALDSEPLR